VAGNRGMLLRHFLQARQNSGAGGAESGEYALQLSELRDRVQELTEELERLRASQAVQPAAANSTTVAGAAKTRARKKTNIP
jgi:hypothetical protein